MKNVLIITSFFLIVSYSVNAQHFEVDSLILDCSNVPDNALQVLFKKNGDFEFNSHSLLPLPSGYGHIVVNYTGCVNNHDSLNQSITKDTLLYFNDPNSDIRPGYDVKFHYDSTASNCEKKFSIKDTSIRISCTKINSVFSKTFNKKNWKLYKGGLRYQGDDNISNVKLINSLGQVIFEDSNFLVSPIIATPNNKGMLFIHYQINHHWYIEKILLTD